MTLVSKESMSQGIKMIYQVNLNGSRVIMVLMKHKRLGKMVRSYRMGLEYGIQVK